MRSLNSAIWRSPVRTVDAIFLVTEESQGFDGVIDSQPDKIIPFQPFCPHGDVKMYYHGRLPHWRQKGCTYFVTFRLADSLPQSFWAEFDERREIWLRRHGIDPECEQWELAFEGLSGEVQRGYEKEIALFLNQRLDRGYGSCVLRRTEISKLVSDSLMFFQGEKVWTGDYVVMPNHAHALMTPLGNCELEDILRSVKGYTAKRINAQTGGESTVWSKESYDHIVRDADQLRAFQKYIQNNPAKAGLRDGEFRMPEKEWRYEIVRR